MQDAGHPGGELVCLGSNPSLATDTSGCEADGTSGDRQPQERGMARMCNIAFAAILALC